MGAYYSQFVWRSVAALHDLVCGFFISHLQGSRDDGENMSWRVPEAPGLTHHVTYHEDKHWGRDAGGLAGWLAGWSFRRGPVDWQNMAQSALVPKWKSSR